MSVGVMFCIHMEKAQFLAPDRWKLKKIETRKLRRKKPSLYPSRLKGGLNKGRYGIRCWSIAATSVMNSSATNSSRSTGVCAGPEGSSARSEIALTQDCVAHRPRPAPPKVGAASLRFVGTLRQA